MNSAYKEVLYDLYLKAAGFATKSGEISSPVLQKKFSVSYYISAGIMDLLELNKVISKRKQNWRYEIINKDI